MEVPVSPKSQLWAVTTPVDRSVKLTVSGAVPEVGLAEKTATGAVWGSVTPMACEAESVPPGPVTVSVAVKFPAVL